MLVGAGFLVLVGRALYVQVLQSDFFQKKGEERYASTLNLPASRGRIVDRHGQILAISVNAPTVAVNPQQFKADANQKRELLTLLRVTPKELDAKLAEGGAYTVLRRQVDDGVVQQIRKLQVKGLQIEPGYLRRYPESEAAAHVVGFTDIEDHGQEGIELAFQRQLQGQGGSRGVVKDRLGRIVEELGDTVDPHDGRDVHPDHRLQGPGPGLPAPARRRHRAQGQGRQRGGARRPERRDPGPGQLPELCAGRARQPGRRATAQPRHHRRVRARLHRQALCRGARAGRRA